METVKNAWCDECCRYRQCVSDFTRTIQGKSISVGICDDCCRYFDRRTLDAKLQEIAERKAEKVK